MNQTSTCVLLFNVSVKTEYLQHVRLVGNIPQMGNWDPAKGLVLSTTQDKYPQWFNDHIDVPSGTKIQFKCVIMYGNKVIKWEELTTPNREYTAQYFKTVVYLKFNSNIISDKPLIKTVSGQMSNVDFSVQEKYGKQNFSHYYSDSMITSSSGESLSTFKIPKLDNEYQKHIKQLQNKIMVNQKKQQILNNQNQKTQAYPFSQGTPSKTDSGIQGENDSIISDPYPIFMSLLDEARNESQYNKEKYPVYKNFKDYVQNVPNIVQHNTQNQLSSGTTPLSKRRDPMTNNTNQFNQQSEIQNTQSGNISSSFYQDKKSSVEEQLSQQTLIFVSWESPLTFLSLVQKSSSSSSDKNGKLSEKRDGTASSSYANNNSNLSSITSLDSPHNELTHSLGTQPQDQMYASFKLQKTSSSSVGAKQPISGGIQKKNSKISQQIQRKIPGFSIKIDDDFIYKNKYKVKVSSDLVLSSLYQTFLAKEIKFMWVTHCSLQFGNKDEQKEFQDFVLQTYKIYLLFYTKDEIHIFQRQYLNKMRFKTRNIVLLEDDQSWDIYKRINKEFTDIAYKFCESQSPIFSVIVYDFHLFLVPSYIRYQIQEKQVYDLQKVQITFFMNRPFPQQELFAQLPEYAILLHSLLFSDTIIFSSHEYAEPFFRTLEKNNLFHKHNSNGVITLPYNGREIVIMLEHPGQTSIWLTMPDLSYKSK